MATEIVPATTAHAERLAASLSEESRRGLEALMVDPLVALLSGLKGSSSVRAILIDDEVAAVVGVVPREWGGQLWFLTSDLVLRAPREFLRGARQAFSEVGQGYNVLANIADARNERTLRLARHFGFERHDWGVVNGHPFVLTRWEAPLVHRT